MECPLSRYETQHPGVHRKMANWSPGAWKAEEQHFWPLDAKHAHRCLNRDDQGVFKWAIPSLSPPCTALRTSTASNPEGPPVRHQRRSHHRGASFCYSGRKYRCPFTRDMGVSITVPSRTTSQASSKMCLLSLGEESLRVSAAFRGSCLYKLLTRTAVTAEEKWGSGLQAVEVCQLPQNGNSNPLTGNKNGPGKYLPQVYVPLWAWRSTTELCALVPND